MAKIIDIATRKKWTGSAKPPVKLGGSSAKTLRRSQGGNWVSIEEAAAPVIGGLMKAR